MPCFILVSILFHMVMPFCWCMVTVDCGFWKELCNVCSPAPLDYSSVYPLSLPPLQTQQDVYTSVFVGCVCVGLCNFFFFLRLTCCCSNQFVLYSSQYQIIPFKTAFRSLTKKISGQIDRIENKNVQWGGEEIFTKILFHFSYSQESQWDHDG